jgi:hypothetical protein
MSKQDEEVVEESPFTFEDLSLRIAIFFITFSLIPFAAIWAIKLITGTEMLQYDLQSMAAVSIILILLDNILNNDKRTATAEPEEDSQ